METTNYKKQNTNKFQISSAPKVYDLEERTFLFARDVALATKKLQGNQSSLEYRKQVVRSSGSVGANYIEANESLSKKDFLMRIKICRKEAKESAYWLRLLSETNDAISAQLLSPLHQEAIELKKIFSAMIEKTSS